MIDIAQKKTKPVRNILIVENDEGLVDLLEELFKYEGYCVKCYQQAEDIFSLMEGFTPHVVLLDYLLPGINGGELCAQLKRKASTNHIPVIIFSAYPQVLRSLGNYGCNAFISKPFELSALLDQVNECLENPLKVLPDKGFEKGLTTSGSINE